MQKRVKALSIVIAVFTALAMLFSSVQPAFAATVKANVVTQTSFKVKLGDSNSYSTFTQKYKYNSKGLLINETTYTPEGTVQYKIDYKYNSNNLVKSATVSEFGKKMATVSNTYNKKNQLTKRVTKGVSYDYSITVKYTYNKKGVLTKSVQTFTNDSYMPGGTKITTTYKFNSKGVLSKMTVKNDAYKDFNSTRTYTYDKNGFLKKYTYKGASDSGYLTRKLTYKNGKLTKYQDTDHFEGNTYKDNARTVKTRTISVTKARSAIVSKQQQEIINKGYGTDIYLGYDYM